MERPTERQVADWLLALAPLVAASMPAADARERVKAYVPNLVDRFDSRDFNGSSREFVARNCRFFPSYGELCQLLDKWPRPAAKPLVATPVDVGLDATDRAWIEFWHRRRAEIFGQQSGWKWGSREADLANVESLIRQQSFKAWRVLFDPQHAEHQAPSEREGAYVSDVVQTWRDRKRDLEPKPPNPEHRLPDDAPERPKPAYLSPEVLAQRRPVYKLEVPGDAEIRNQTAEADA